MSEPGRVFTGWLLHPEDREALLARFPPRYVGVVAHHVTQTYGDPDAPLSSETRGEVIGEADDGEGVQALVVRIAGGVERADGSSYHLTWSIAPGRQARESNAVIAGVGFVPLGQPIPIRLEPRLFAD